MHSRCMRINPSDASTKRERSHTHEHLTNRAAARSTTVYAPSAHRNSHPIPYSLSLQAGSSQTRGAQPASCARLALSLGHIDTACRCVTVLHGLPRIYDGHTGRFEVGDIAGHDRQPVHQCGGQDVPIPLRLGIWNMESGGLTCDLPIDGQRPPREGPSNILLHPPPPYRSPPRVATLDLQYTEFDLG